MGGFAANQQVILANGEMPTLLELMAAQADPSMVFAQPRGREFKVFTIRDQGIQIASTAGTMQDGIIGTGFVRDVRKLQDAAPIFAVQLQSQDPRNARRKKLLPKLIYVRDSHLFSMIDGTLKSVRTLRMGMRLRPLTTDLLPGTSPDIQPLVQGPPRVLQASVSLPVITFVSATLVGMQASYGMTLEGPYTSGVIAVPVRDPRAPLVEDPNNPDPDTHARGVFVYAS